MDPFLGHLLLLILNVFYFKFLNFPERLKERFFYMFINFSAF